MWASLVSKTVRACSLSGAPPRPRQQHCNFAMARRLSVVVEEDGLGEPRSPNDEVDLEKGDSWNVPHRGNGDIQVLSYPMRKSPTTHHSSTSTTALEDTYNTGGDDDDNYKGDESDEQVDTVEAPTAVDNENAGEECKGDENTDTQEAPTAVEDNTAGDDDFKEDETLDTDDITITSRTENANISKKPDAGGAVGTGGTGGGVAAGKDWASSAERRQLRNFFARSHSRHDSSFVPPMLSSRASSMSSIDSGNNSISSRLTVSSRQQRSVEQRSMERGPKTSSVEPGFVFPAGFSLDTRREIEVAILKRFEKLNINPNIGEFWMMIDAAWVDRWVLFATASAGPPGPITNRNLYSHVVPAYLDDDNDDSVGSNSGASAFFNAGASSMGLADSGLAQGLKIARDYRALHPLAWYILESFYGTDGAPDICRSKADIYSHPVSVTRRLKAEKENQTKAIHVVSRAVQKVKNKLAAKNHSTTSGVVAPTYGGD